jgi:hypothetical protein
MEQQEGEFTEEAQEGENLPAHVVDELQHSRHLYCEEKRFLRLGTLARPLTRL